MGKFKFQIVTPEGLSYNSVYVTDSTDPLVHQEIVETSLKKLFDSWKNQNISKHDAGLYQTLKEYGNKF